MKNIKLILFILITTPSFCQWTTRDFNETSGRECNIGAIGTSWKKLTIINDSTGFREYRGHNSPSSSFTGFKVICSYGTSENSWDCGGNQFQYNSAELGLIKKIQFLDLNTFFYIERISEFGYDIISNQNGSVFSFSPNPFNGSALNDYFFINSNHGFINLNDSTSDLLIEYNNGILDTIYTLLDHISTKIEFPNNSLGFLQRENLISNKKQLMRSNDSGQNWTVVKDSLSSDLKEIDFVSNSVGFITLSNDSIFKTKDNGVNWDAIFIDYNRFQGIYDFVTENLWYAVASNDSLLKTYDHGLSWVYDSLTVDNIQDIEIRNDNLGYVTGSDCKLYTKQPEASLNLNQVYLYPNPAFNVLNIKTNSNNKVELIQLFNIKGVLVLENYNANKIDISGISTGVYIIKLTHDGSTIAKKFVKQ